MKVSNFPIFTQKDVPSEAEIISHQLMIKSGMIRKLSSGQYSWTSYRFTSYPKNRKNYKGRIK